ncbi:Ccc1 family [Babesia duncani]|uniref:Ccc1 family n=1 Tax=Babesia duncani TaxID=323732 RepID=A0AAD9PNW8_9APIC|nr:Ccc1 family [Babesia duncani]
MAEPKESRSSHSSDHVEDHSLVSGEALKVIVFGGLDGIMTIFALVAGCVGTDVRPWQTVGLGLGTLFASAFSMGFGEYVSAQAEAEYVKSELNREKHEVETVPVLEKQEMHDIYTKRYSFSPRSATNLVEIIFKNKKFFLHHMMVEELGILLQDDDLGPLKRGLLMFVSHFLFGLLPLVGVFGFLITGSTFARSIYAFLLTSIFSLLGTMALGYYKGTFTRQDRVKSALWMGLNGLIAGGSSYLIGWILTVLFPR